MDVAAIGFFLVVALVSLAVFTAMRHARRRRFIDDYHFPVRVARAVRDRYPALVDADVKLVMRGLREYFHVCREAGRRPVAMPSQAVDVAWHEFILFTRAWRISCARERISPKSPAALPLLFAIDAQLGIADGFRYVPDCAQEVTRGADGGGTYCGAHIGCSSGCSGDSGGADGGGGDGGGGCGGD